MTTSLGVEPDRYAVPTPTATDPVVLPHRISPDNRYPNSRYGDLTWSLGPLIDNPSAQLSNIRWMRCPAGLREQVKMVAWTMINGELRATYVQTRGAKARARWSAGAIQDIIGEWIRLAPWLHDHELTDLAACTRDHWRRYVADRRADRGTREHATKVLSWLTHLWAFDQLASCRIGIVQPP